MTSPLDGRIRTAARAAAAELMQAAVQATGGVDAAGLQQQITDLHEHLHHAATAIKRLEDRIDMLEKPTNVTDPEQGVPARRPRRKTTDE